jgi:RimJ/RimL family protein N-acetyltransferase
MIQLRPIRHEDIVEIKSWPSYSGGLGQMDYALRENGWLDEFRDKPNTWIFAVVVNDHLRGFSLLSLGTDKEAEFRIAIHPDWTGRGLGREVTLATLRKGFEQLGLVKIHLIVRKNNPRALNLYARIGFAAVGESVHIIQGKRIEFIDRTMTKEQFEDINEENR